MWNAYACHTHDRRLWMPVTQMTDDGGLSLSVSRHLFNISRLQAGGPGGGGGGAEILGRPGCEPAISILYSHRGHPLMGSPETQTVCEAEPAAELMAREFILIPQVAVLPAVTAAPDGFRRFSVCTRSGATPSGTEMASREHTT